MLGCIGVAPAVARRLPLVRREHMAAIWIIKKFGKVRRYATCERTRRVPVHWGWAALEGTERP